MTIFGAILFASFIFTSCRGSSSIENAKTTEQETVDDREQVGEEEESECLDCGMSEAEDVQETQPQTQWVNCSECHGTGLKQCYECDGSGQLECSTIRIYSYQCSGCENTAPCPRCNGTAIVKCYACYGRGNKGNCDSCDGRGQVQI